MLDLDAIRENSGISVTVDGVFLHHGSPVENAKVQQIFSEGLEVREDGRAILRVGPQWCYVTPLDTVHIVLGLSGPQGTDPVVRFNTGAREKLNPEQLWVSEKDVLYAWVQDGRVLARFSRTAYHQLFSEYYDVQEGGEGWAISTAHGPVDIPQHSRAGIPLVKSLV